MKLCEWCSNGRAHTVLEEPETACDCGCHQVLVVKEYDAEVLWLPGANPDVHGTVLKIRLKPIPGIVLQSYYREPGRLELGPWVENDEVHLDVNEVRDLKAALNQLAVFKRKAFRPSRSFAPSLRVP